LMAWKVGKGMYIIPLLFAFTPLVTGTWLEKFEVFSFALLGIMCFSIVMEGYWDKKMNILERVLFGVAAALLLCQDSAFDIESSFDILQNTHLVGLFVLVLVMYYHKITLKERKKHSSVV